MNDSINLIFDEDGTAKIYDYTYDITIHCESQEEQDKVWKMLNRRWIPCSERLPEENGQYLITVKYVHVDGYDDIYAEHGEWTNGKWDMFCFGHCGKVENIIAWMPLPEPYGGE